MRNQRTKYYIRLGKYYDKLRNDKSHKIKEGMAKAKFNGEHIGRRPKYKRNNSKVQYVLHYFPYRKHQENESAKEFIQYLSDKFQISVPTIYRLAHKYLGFSNKQ